MSSTINDVAKLAGTSRQTVSRVLNDPSLVNPETLQKVKKAIEMLDYHPNITARNLANRIVKTVGLFMPFTVAQARRNMFFSAVSSIICHRCAEEDFVLQLFASTPHEDYGTLFKRLYRERKVGGLILTCPSVKNKELVDLLSAKIPFILLGRPGIDLEQISYVDADNVEAARLAALHLIGLGHERLCLLNAPKWMTLSTDLRKGVERALTESGLSSGNLTEAHTDLTLEVGFDQMLGLLGSGDRPTAVITADDLLALGVKKAADELGISIPEQLSLVSVTKNGWGDLLPLNLTYVETEFEQLGVSATEYIMKVINKETDAPLRAVSPVELRIGQSCAPPQRP